MTKEEAEKLVSAIRSEFPDTVITAVNKFSENTCCVGGALMQYAFKHRELFKVEPTVGLIRAYKLKNSNNSLPFDFLSRHYPNISTLTSLLLIINPDLIDLVNDKYNVGHIYAIKISSSNDNEEFYDAWQILIEALSYNKSQTTKISLT